MPCRDMCRVEGTRLAAEEAFGQVMRIPKVEIANLRPLCRDDPEQMARRNLKGSGVTGRHENRSHCLSPRT